MNLRYLMVLVWQIILTLTLLIFSLVFSYIDWHGFKPLLEFEHYGNVSLFIAQYLYYSFEVALFTLIIVALTWGIGHMLSKKGVASTILGFGMGLSFIGE
ncbi:hypothetical protein Hs30E_03770 [Lactococcus hodotermopsidis]|uniref:Uncharacterized protein n=1 Tax=Pseudolactococcus hodotermopsidis TaxID=2709157 RepID=A0A6A0BAJ9_9LACT|nr:hypothetical protein Hs30E_03770 [Lactococcus hodotermopsidis]